MQLGGLHKLWNSLHITQFLEIQIYIWAAHQIFAEDCSPQSSDITVVSLYTRYIDIFLILLSSPIALTASKAWNTHRFYYD